MKFLAMKCQNKVDIGFILDSSGSLRSEYQKEKDFIKFLAARFNMDAEGARVGVITFSFFSDISIKFSDFLSQSDFDEAIDEIPLMGSTTRLDRALVQARDELFLEKNGARVNVPKVLIVLTDGTQTIDEDSLNPGEVADSLRLDGVKLISIGIGDKTDRAELLSIAGKQDNVFIAKDFDVLKSPKFIEEFTEATCREGKSKHFFVVLYKILGGCLNLIWMKEIK